MFLLSRTRYHFEKQAATHFEKQDMTHFEKQAATHFEKQAITNFEKQATTHFQKQTTAVDVCRVERNPRERRLKRLAPPAPILVAIDHCVSWGFTKSGGGGRGVWGGGV